MHRHQTHMSFAALVGLLQLGTKSTHHTYIYSQGLLRIVCVFMCVCMCVCSASTHCMHTHLDTRGGTDGITYVLYKVMSC